MEHLLSSKLLLLGDRTHRGSLYSSSWGGTAPPEGALHPFPAAVVDSGWVEVTTCPFGVERFEGKTCDLHLLCVGWSAGVPQSLYVCDVRGIKHTDVWSSLGWTLAPSSAALWYGFTSLLFKYINQSSNWKSIFQSVNVPVWVKWKWKLSL